MNPKISLIIPVYNVEKYLAECLDSCVNQTLRDIEIICVDDCSTDSSFKILKEYERKDSRVKVFQQGENKKQGAARNAGLQIATGEYIWFVDSDDFIDLRSCQLLYDVARKNDADVLMFQLQTFYDEEKERNYVEDYYYTDLPKNKNFSLKEYKYKNENIPVSPCMYISKREFVQNYKFREGVYFEDTDFTTILLTDAKKIRALCFTAYNRRITPNSTIQSPMSEKKLQDLISVDLSLADYVKSHSVPRKTFLHTFYVSHVNYVFGLLRENEKMEIPPQIKKDFLELKHENDAFDKKITVRIRRKVVRILEKAIRLVEKE